MVLLKEEGGTNFPAFCDEEWYILSARACESVFHPILEEIQEHMTRSLADYIPIGLDNKEH